MTQYGFHFDQNRCYGCQACDIACKDWNGIEPGAEKLMCVYEWETGTFPDVRIHNLAFPCAHCDDPACLKACETGAIYKEDRYGAVLVDAEKCNGCRKCYKACPYGAPKFASDEPGEKMHKCDVHRPIGAGSQAGMRVELPATCLRLWSDGGAHSQVHGRALLPGHARSRAHAPELPHLEPAREEAARAL